MASTHKPFAHLFGKPYANAQIRYAILPLDLFTSTPDYTPYTHKQRVWPMACGGDATRAEQQLSASWQYDLADEQPGLDAQVMRWMRGKQLTELSAEQRADIALRQSRFEERAARLRALGVDPAQWRDDDD